MKRLKRALYAHRKLLRRLTIAAFVLAPAASIAAEAVTRAATGGYLKYDKLIIIWVASSLAGFYLASWHIIETFLDRRAIRKSPVPDKAKLNVVNTGLVSELMRIAVHVVFVSLGVYSMFVPPFEVGPDGAVEVKTWFVQALTWAFIALPAWIAVASAYALFMRKRLEAIVAARRS